MTKTQKKELKNRFFKILHIVSYALSIIFIIVLIVSMVQSCGSSKKTAATSSQPNNALPLLSEPKRAPVTNDNNYYNYVLNFNYFDETDFNLNDQYDLSLLEVNLTTAYNEAQPHQNVYLYKFSENYRFAYFLDEDGVYRNLGNIVAGFDTYLSSNAKYYYRLTGISIDTQEGGYGEEILYKKYLNGGAIPFPADNYTYTISDEAFYILVDNGGSMNNIGLRQLYSVDPNMSNYSFVSDIKFYGKIGLDNDVQYFQKYQTPLETYTINTPDFIVGGKVYNGIKMYYEDASELYFALPSDWAVAHKTWRPIANSPYKYFTKMTYVSASGGDELVVNTRDKTLYEVEGNGIEVILPSSSWVNDAYRFIKFAYGVNSDTLEELNKINDNNVSGSKIYSDYSIFDLISMSFGSFTTIFSLTILPGITIGTLLFLPLVVIVIFAIIKVVKK